MADGVKRTAIGKGAWRASSCRATSSMWKVGAGTGERLDRLRQVPDISSAIVVMDPRTGRVLATTGGFSFARRASSAPLGRSASQFVVQALRLRRRARQRLHAVVAGARRADRDQSRRRTAGVGSQRELFAEFYGPSTCYASASKQSRNTMTVRLMEHGACRWW